MPGKLLKLWIKLTWVGLKFPSASHSGGFCRNPKSAFLAFSHGVFKGLQKACELPTDLSHFKWGPHISCGKAGVWVKHGSFSCKYLMHFLGQHEQKSLGLEYSSK